MDYKLINEALLDISALRYDYRYEYKKTQIEEKVTFNNEEVLQVYLRFNQEGLVKQLNFIDINENYSSKDYHYVIGCIKLSDIILAKDLILKDGAFIADTGNHVAATNA